MNTRTAPRVHATRLRALTVAFMAVVALIASVVVVTASAPPARAAVTGAINNLTLSSTTLAQGTTGRVCFDWSFPDGSEAGDTVSFSAATDFALSPLPAFPTGVQPIMIGTTEVARITVSGNTVTVTRTVGADSWGEVSSDEAACVTFAYSGNIASGEDRNTVWPAHPSNFTIPIKGTTFTPSTYWPNKSGTFSFSATGVPQITWTFKSPVGPVGANEVTITDVIGPGQELQCDSINGSIRWWDQSFFPGQDAWQGTLTWAGGAPTTCTTAGFTGTLASTIPAPQPGGNTAIDPPTRPTRIAYALINYTTVITDLSLVTEGWVNDVDWTNATTTRPFHGVVRMPGTATGNRAITVSKTVSGDVQQADGVTFGLAVACTNPAGAPVAGYPRTILVEAGQSAPVYAPIGSTCSVTEPDAQGAAATPSAPVTLTSGLTDTFALSVNNHFTAPRPATVTQQVTVSKALAGDPDLAQGKQFTLEVDCAAGGQSLTGFPQSLVFTGAGSQTVPVTFTNDSALTVACSVSEPDTQGASSAVASPPVHLTAVNDQAVCSDTSGTALATCALSVTNTYTAVTPTPTPTPTVSPSPTPTPTPEPQTCGDVGPDIPGALDQTISGNTGNTSSFFRFASKNRVLTALYSAQNSHGWCDVAILASSADYTDALAAAPLAEILNAPILLANSDGTLDPQVKSYLANNFDGVVIVSGPGVIPESTKNELNNALASVGGSWYAGVNTVRIAGVNRYETAGTLAIASLLWSEEDRTSGVNFLLADGRNFPDALASGPAASATRNGVVLLTAGEDGVPSFTARFLSGSPVSFSPATLAWLPSQLPGGVTIDWNNLGAFNHQSITVVGGAAKAAADKGVLGLATEPVEYDDALVGKDRYETATLIAKKYFRSGATYYTVASGVNFPDAIVAGGWAANVHGPLLLTREAALTPVTKNYLVAAADNGDKFVVFGGAGSVSPAVSKELASTFRW